MSPGLTLPSAHCYNTRQCTGAVAVMPSVVPLLLSREGIIGKLKKRNRQTQTDSKAVATAGTVYKALCPNATDLFL